VFRVRFLSLFFKHCKLFLGLGVDRRASMWSSPDTGNDPDRVLRRAARLSDPGPKNDPSAQTLRKG
jgi:hypothetical protein